MQTDAMQQLKSWTRERFALPQDADIVVIETQCAEPGFPPLETIVVFRTPPANCHNFRVFKPLAEIVPDDLPPAWMKDAIIMHPSGCPCC
jgi:nitrate reductase delta subunit